MRKIEDIHKLHDGELEPGAPAPELDEADRLRLQAIGDVGAAVRNTLEAQSRGVDLWSGLEARLVAADRHAHEQAQKKAAIHGWRARSRGWGYGLSAMAAAAVAAFALWFGASRGAAASNNADIEELDVTGAAAAVMQVPDHKDASQTTTVIWVGEQ